MKINFSQRQSFAPQYLGQVYAYARLRLKLLFITSEVIANLFAKTNGKNIAKKITVSNKQGKFWHSLLIIKFRVGYSLSIQISNIDGQHIGPWFTIGIDCVEDIIA